MHPVFILALLVAVLLYISWYKRAPTSKQRQVRNRGLIFGAAALLVIAALTGRLPPLFAALGVAIPVVMRLLAVAQAWQSAKAFGNVYRSARGPSPGQRSGIETRYLRMQLNHDSGEMDGEVREGPFRGRWLSQLDLGELVQLYTACRAQDGQSATVLEAYLDRVHGDAWREQVSGAQEPAHHTDDHMTRAEAQEVLGVQPGASREEIIAAHRRLMQKFHPDRGGSTYLAAKINRAKDLLLGRA